MKTKSALEILKLNSALALTYVKNHKVSFTLFVLFLFVQDIANYFVHDYLSIHELDSRLVEGLFQLFFLWSAVFFFHSVDCQESRRDVSYLKIAIESLLLFPGFLLQSIFWMISFVLGLAFLVVPGIYAGIVFYMAPMISVLYPDYSGRTFMLSREFAHQDLLAAFVLVVVTSFIPFIPEALLFFVTGTLKSIWGLIYSPLGAGVYLFCELIFLYFVREKVEAQRQFPQ